MRELEDALSSIRLAGYAGSTPSERLASYRRNIQLCQALYPTLHFVEVVLRNRMHVALSRHFETEWWFDKRDVVSHKYAVEQIESAKRLRGDQDVTADDVVGHVSFGFWRGLFLRSYENMWRAIMFDVFPYIPARDASRRALNDRVDRINTLRNRVFHHETIVRTDPAQAHGEMHQLLSWLSPEALGELERIDSFRAVHDSQPRR